MKEANCYLSKRLVKKYDLLISETDEFDLTQDRVYVAKSEGYGNLVLVLNDKGIEDEYTTEHFRFYSGQRVED